MKILRYLIWLLFPTCAFGQGIIYQLSPPAPNAQVRFCPVPDAGYPCPVLTTVYSDSAATQVVAQPITLGSGGNLTVYFAANTTSATVQLSGPGYGPNNRTVISLGGGGGITSVATLPATCTPGTTAPVQLSVAPYGVYYCPATNQWSASSTSGPNQVNALAFGVKADVKWITDATLANTTAVIDCTFTNDCNFVAATDNNKICWATSAQTDLSQNSTVVLPEGTLTVTDAQHATCSGGNATANQTHNALFLWGHLDTATSVQTQSTANDPLLAAWTAAANSCSQLVLPSGAMFVERGEFITFPVSGVSGTPYCGQGISIEYARIGFGLKGQARAGAGATVLIPTPNFPPTDCTGPNGGGTVCLMAFKNPVVSDLQVWGAGNNSCTGFSGKTLSAAQGDNTAGGSNGLYRSVMFQSWCGNSSGVLGFGLGNGQAFSGLELHDVWSEFYGCTPVDFSGANIVDWYGGSFWGGCSGTSALVMEAGATVNLKTVATLDGNGSAGGVATACVTCTWYSFGDYFFNSSTTAATLNLKGTSYLDGDYINLSAAGSYGIYAVANPATVHLHNTSVNGTVTANHSFFADTSSTMNVFDDGGNIIPTGTVTGTGAFRMFNSASTTGAGLAANCGSFLTSGWGTSTCAAVTTSDSHHMKFTITAAGAPGASPVVTVTFPTVFNFGTQAPASCSIQETAGTFGVLTNPVVGTPTTTTVAITFAGTAVATQTYTYDLICGP